MGCANGLCEWVVRMGCANGLCEWVVVGWPAGWGGMACRLECGLEREEPTSSIRIRKVASSDAPAPT
eukprot:6234477-Prymnesium_polylepis.1